MCTRVEQYTRKDPRKNPSDTQVNESWVSSGFPGEHEDSHEDWEEHMRPNDFDGEIEDEDAMCVGANVGRRYPRDNDGHHARRVRAL